jgi:hypothetical protein
MSATAPKINGRTPRVAAVAADLHAVGLMDALLKISTEVPKLVATEPGQIQNRTYLYVTLDALLDVVNPILIAHDLVWVTKPTITETGQPALRYRLTHVPSGEFEEDVMPLMGATDSQGVGSALTYARRYALLAVLNLAPGADDDGAGASAGPPVDRYAQAAAAHAQLPPASAPSTAAVPQPVAAAPKPSGRPATAKQKTMIEARARAADLTAQEMANVLKVARGEETVIWQDGAAAKRWADRELQRLPATLVDAVLAGIKAKS